MKKLWLLALPPLALVAIAFMVAAGTAAIPASTQSRQQCPQGQQAAPVAAGVLTAAQAAQVLYAAGFRQPQLADQVAIDDAESGLNSDAIQQGQPYATTGYGLGQVTPGDSEPQCGVDEALLDPAANACAQYAKFTGKAGSPPGAAGSQDPWTTFTLGVYRQFLAQAQQGVQDMGAAPSCTTGGTLEAGVAGGVAPGPLGVPQPEGLTAVEPGAPFCHPPLAAGDVTDLCSGMFGGQCTWWAADNVSIDWLGNAWQWWANAAAAGRQESQTPQLGWIADWGPGLPGSGGAGHVAVVVGVAAASVTVSEMNYLGPGLVDERTDPLPDPYLEGYIAP